MTWWEEILAKATSLQRAKALKAAATENRYITNLFKQKKQANTQRLATTYDLTDLDSVKKFQHYYNQRARNYGWNTISEDGILGDLTSKAIRQLSGDMGSGISGMQLFMYTKLNGEIPNQNSNQFSKYLQFLKTTPYYKKGGNLKLLKIK